MSFSWVVHDDLFSRETKTNCASAYYQGFQLHLLCHGGEIYSDWGWHKKCRGFCFIKKTCFDNFISSFRLWQQYCDFEVKIALLNSFDIFSEDLSQNLVYLRVSWYGKDLGWLCKMQFLLNMFALRMFDEAQDVCAKTIKSLFKQCSLYSSRQLIKKLPG